MRLLFLLPLAFLAGCLPIPNTRVHAPRIEGTVLRDGAPVEGAAVRLHAMRGEDALARTDAAGRFALGPVTKFYLTKSIGDPVYSYELAIEAADGRYLGLTRRELGAPPGDFKVVCELGRPQPLPGEKLGRARTQPAHHCAPRPDPLDYPR